LRVAQGTEARGQTILKETRLLIEGDQEPGSDLYQEAANSGGPHQLPHARSCRKPSGARPVTAINPP
jgi:hypothetical protein